MRALSCLKLGAIQILGRSAKGVRVHSPEILLVVGIAGGITAAASAVGATLRINGVAEEFIETKQKIIEGKKNGHTPAGQEYTEQDGTEDLTKLYVQTTVKFAKIYGPSIALGIASIVCILVSHGIMARRQAALVTAYGALNEMYKKYREHIINKYGEDEDLEARLGIFNKKVDKSGEVSYELKDPDGNPSEYARFFDEFSDRFEPDPVINMSTIMTIQSMMNDRLQRKKVVFLNEVYDQLGIPRTQVGQYVGWVKQGKNEPTVYIDFGIHTVRNRHFVNGFERAVLIDPNVQGPVIEYL